MVWHFIGVYIVNRILHGRLEIRNFSSLVEKNICKRVKYFSTLEEKFRIFGRPCNILYICSMYLSSGCGFLDANILLKGKALGIKF